MLFKNNNFIFPYSKFDNHEYGIKILKENNIEYSIHDSVVTIKIPESWIIKGGYFNDTYMIYMKEDNGSYCCIFNIEYNKTNGLVNITVG